MPRYEGGRRRKLGSKRKKKLTEKSLHRAACTGGDAAVQCPGVQVRTCLRRPEESGRSIHLGSRGPGPALGVVGWLWGRRGPCS